MLLTAYEWMRQTGDVVHEATDLGKGDWATGIEVEKLVEHYEDRLDEAGLLLPAGKGRRDEDQPAQSVVADADDAGRCADAARDHAADGPLEGKGLRLDLGPLGPSLRTKSRT